MTNQPVEERFLEEGIAPQLIPAMSAGDLDTVRSPGNGIGTFIFAAIGRPPGGLIRGQQCLLCLFLFILLF
jgi:hypothetical protein